LTSTALGKTITVNALSLNNLILNGVGGGWTMQDALTVAGTLTLTNGALYLNGMNLSVTGAFTVSGTLGLNGDEVVTPTLNAGSTIEYTATSGTRAIKNWDYTNITVKINGAGGTFTLPAALTCASINVAAGTFDVSASNYAIDVSGNWVNSGGVFNPRLGTVTLSGVGAVTISGSTTFYNLTSTTAGKQITFAAGTTQTISGTLTLTGLAGNLIVLRSSLTGTQWRIDPQGVRNISYVDVKDSNNISSVMISPINSTNSGNNTNWFAGQNNPNENNIEKATQESNVVVAISAPAPQSDTDSDITISDEGAVSDNKEEKTEKQAQPQTEGETTQTGKQENKAAVVELQNMNFDDAMTQKKFELKVSVITFEGKVLFAPEGEPDKGIFISAGQAATLQGKVGQENLAPQRKEKKI
ncbi:MAG: hypothetical protein V1650_00345, partial [Candidatus Omnitrophota bacterium]